MINLPIFVRVASMVLVYPEVCLLCASEESLEVMGKINLKPYHSEAQTMCILHIDG